jgi:vacuolar-type H+-ATPase catalytic subunit A/Vma1
LSYRQNKPYTEEEIPKIVKKLEGNYSDIKEEGQAFVANIMRELPSLEDSIQNARIYVMNNPNYSYRDYNSIAEEYIQDLLSNNQNFINYLNQSKSFQEIMYGAKDKAPMENKERRNKLLTVLHYALKQEAQKLMTAA